MNTKNLKALARTLRRDVIEMAYKAGSGHCGGSLSACDILAALYGHVMNIDPSEPGAYGRDRFILSKGHAAPALYAAMARRGYFDADELGTLRVFGSRLQGHPSMRTLEGVEMSTGSLGLGVPVACGMALSMRRRGEQGDVWVLCGDGELQEGSNWEAFMSINKWQLNTVKVIIDCNGVQLDGTTDAVMPMGDIGQKLAAFGLTVIECDGHNMEDLVPALERARASGIPCAIVAKTVKGKGVPFMEGRSEWHGRTLLREDYAAAVAALEVNR